MITFLFPENKNIIILGNDFALFTKWTLDWYGNVLVALTASVLFFHQGNTTIRSVWGRLHTGSRRRLRTIKQPRDQLPGAVFLLERVEPPRLTYLRNCGTK